MWTWARGRGALRFVRGSRKGSALHYRGFRLRQCSMDYTIPYYTILYYTILYYTIPYCTILYYTILYHTILYYTILYYTILYYTILYYTILYYTIPQLVESRIHLLLFCICHRTWEALEMRNSQYNGSKLLSGILFWLLAPIKVTMKPKKYIFFSKVYIYIYSFLGGLLDSLGMVWGHIQGGRRIPCRDDIIVGFTD